ncbi:MAG: hypothetical protein K940chlam7_00743 [Chlamydiae bacterium]|nr:hypothetical protein [Chlamydiota bacterium]
MISDWLPGCTLRKATLEENNKISYIHFKTGLFGSHYVDVKHEDLSYLANNLKLEGPNLSTSTSHVPGCISWGKGIAACVIGGLLLSTGSSWNQISGQNPISDAITMMKGTLGPAAFKAALIFQMSALAVVSRQEGGAIPSALLAGMMFLPEPVMGQSLCPQFMGSYNTPSTARDVAVSGNYAYVADTYGLQIIDVRNVTNPTLAGFYNTPNLYGGVAVSGNYAFMAGSNISGFQIIDVSNVANPTLAGSYGMPHDGGVAVLGNYAYMAYDYLGLQIIDVSNKTNPMLAGFYDTPGRAFGVYVSGDYAYVADYTSGLQILDLTCFTRSSSGSNTSISSSISNSTTSLPSNAGSLPIKTTTKHQVTAGGSDIQSGEGAGAVMCDSLI